MRLVLLSVVLVGVLGCDSAPTANRRPDPAVTKVRIERAKNKVFQGALKQLQDPAHYDGGYYAIKYPNGDVPKDRGACTDVVIRALRHDGKDLQRLVSEDIARRPYPNVKVRDRNIDHRRVPNLVRFLKTCGKTLTTSTSSDSAATWLPGDIVCWKLSGNRDHIGVVSDRKNAAGLPYVIHNTYMTSEEDVLTAWTIVGHYRYPVNG